MKKQYTLILSVAIFTSVSAQTQIQNGDFELWDNPTANNAEPQQFNSNKTGTSIASIGPQTCFRDATVFHGGQYAVRVETLPAPVGGTVVNGNVTTGVVNAPTLNKVDGYIGTIKHNTPGDIRRMTFTGRPDSLVGFYRYTQGGAAEQAKVIAYLHVGNYYDPETATSYHPDSTVNKIASALFVSPAANAANWTRFAVPFTYFDTRTPAYIMISITSSNDQLTTVTGSKLWVDDLQVVYVPTTAIAENKTEYTHVYASEKKLFVDFKNQKQDAIISLFDLTGKVVYTEKVSNTAFSTIDLSAFTNGLYFYQLTGAFMQKTGKFVVK